ncbi:MAG: hypothetical protein KIT58_10430 [Planctomycetota bacterium]|nr:hypothetical protein [Planctomycetota bacterium]
MRNGRGRRSGARARASGAALATVALLGGCCGGAVTPPQVSFVERRLGSAPFDAEVIDDKHSWSPTGRCAAMAVKIGGRTRVLVNEALGPAFDEVPTSWRFPWLVFDRAGERAAYVVNVGGKMHVVDFDGVMSAAYDEITMFSVGPRDTLGWVGMLDGRACAVYDGDEDDLFDAVPPQSLFDPEGRPAYIARDRDGWHYLHDGRRHGPFEGGRRGRPWRATSRGCAVRTGDNWHFLDDDGALSEPFDDVLLHPLTDVFFGRLGGRWVELRRGGRPPVLEVSVPVRVAADEERGLRLLPDGRLVTLVPTAGATTVADLKLHALLPDGRPVLTVAAEGTAWDTTSPKRLVVGDVWTEPFVRLDVVTNGVAWAASAWSSQARAAFLCTTDGVRGPFEDVRVLHLHPDGAVYVALQEGGRWSYEGGPALADVAFRLVAYPALGSSQEGAGLRVTGVIVGSLGSDQPDRLYVVVFDGATASVHERVAGESVQLEDVQVSPAGRILAKVLDYPDKEARNAVLKTGDFALYKRVWRVWAGEREHGPFDGLSKEVHIDAAGARAAFGARVGRELWWKVVDLR